MSEEFDEMNSEFDRIANVLQEMDSGKFPLVIAMATASGRVDFVIGGNLVPSERIRFIKTIIDAYERNGLEVSEAKIGNRTN